MLNKEAELQEKEAFIKKGSNFSNRASCTYFLEFNDSIAKVERNLNDTTWTGEAHMIDLTLEDSQEAPPIVKKENPEQINQGLLPPIKCFD